MTAFPSALNLKQIHRVLALASICVNLVLIFFSLITTNLELTFENTCY